jgi:glycine/D-amino acid oxidase-like deaminating enzyme
MDVFPPHPRSMWLETAGAYTPQPRLEGEAAVDVAIIGGGYTGLMTAYELKRADPGLRVAVVEAREVGFGGSGRNGSFAMTVVGVGFQGTALIKGKEFLRRSHQYMMRAVDELWDLIGREGLDCDGIRPGFLRVGTTPGYVKRLQSEVRLMNSLGFDDIYWLDGDEVRQRVDSPLHLGALWEPRLVLVHPLKLVRAERDLALRYGAEVYENSPVRRVVPGSDGAPYRVETEHGVLRAEKVVFATNAYSHLFPQLRRKQVPAFTHMMSTEPLTPEQLATIGWAGREGLEDSRNLIYHYRRTLDDRITMGGGPVGFTWANSLYRDDDPAAWQQVERRFRSTFPSLRDVRFSHRWGGPFSVTTDLVPAMGYIGGPRAVYSLGCIGHGVSMTHLNAQTLRDMLLERKSDLLDGPFVDRFVLPWPPEPVRTLAGYGMRAVLQLEDWMREAPMRKAGEQAKAETGGIAGVRQVASAGSEPAAAAPPAESETVPTAEGAAVAAPSDAAPADTAPAEPAPVSK